MATTLYAESFADINILERTTLRGDVAANTNQLPVESGQGFSIGDVLFVGVPMRDGCELAVVSGVSATALTLTANLALAHSRFEPVVSAIGNSVRIYRCPNVNGTVPVDELFVPLPQPRSIDPDQQSTWFTDSEGSAAYWYKLTYYNPATGAETSLGDSIAVRGDDFGHYASLNEIRREAGFENAVNLKDSDVDQQRRAAEAEINASLGSAYTVPFVKPIPPIINTLTIQLAAAMLKAHAYGRSAAKGALEDARKAITLYASRDGTIAGEDGVSLATGGGVSSYPDEDAPRAFEMGMRF